MELKLGTYIKHDPPFKTAYNIFKIMPKTVECSVVTTNWDDDGNSPTCIDDKRVSSDYHYRMNKRFLERFLSKAEYLN